MSDFAILCADCRDPDAQPTAESRYLLPLNGGVLELFGGQYLPAPGHVCALCEARRADADARLRMAIKAASNARGAVS